MSLTSGEMKIFIQDRYDPDEICEALEITSEELLDRFRDKLEENWHKFSELEEDVEDAIMQIWRDQNGFD